MLTLASNGSMNPPSRHEPGGVEAVYFDGRHSTAHAVKVTFTPPIILVEGAGFSRSASLH